MEASIFDADEKEEASHDLEDTKNGEEIQLVQKNQKLEKHNLGVEAAWKELKQDKEELKTRTQLVEQLQECEMRFNAKGQHH